MPSLIAQAASPSIGAFKIERFGPDDTLLALVWAAIGDVLLAIAVFALTRPVDGRRLPRAAC